MAIDTLRDELFEAITAGDVDAVRALTAEHGPVVLSLRDEETKATPLLVACKHGQRAVIDLLIDEGKCSFDEIDEDARRGANALCHACWGGQLTLAKELISERGMRVDFRDKGQRSVFYYCCMGGNLDLVKLFLDVYGCLLYTSPSPRDLSTSRMPSSA